MRGHHSILSMRREGYRPAVVFIETSQDEPPWCRDWQTVFTSIATVWVEPTDRVAQLDFRFAHGLVIALTADDSERTASLRAALQAASPKQLIAWNEHGELSDR